MVRVGGSVAQEELRDDFVGVLNKGLCPAVEVESNRVGVRHLVGGVLEDEPEDHFLGRR